MWDAEQGGGGTTNPRRGGGRDGSAHKARLTTKDQKVFSRGGKPQKNKSRQEVIEGHVLSAPSL